MDFRAKPHVRFILNGLVQANEILQEHVFDLEDWTVIGEYVYDADGGRHQAFYAPTKDVHFKDIHIKAGERVQVEQSLKYSSQGAEQLWKSSGLKELSRWSASSDAYSKLFYFINPQKTERNEKAQTPHYRFKLPNAPWNVWGSFVIYDAKYAPGQQYSNTSANSHTLLLCWTKKNKETC